MKWVTPIHHLAIWTTNDSMYRLVGTKFWLTNIRIFNRIIEEKERTIQLLKEMLIKPNVEVNKHSTDNKYNIESPEDYAMKMQLLKYKEEMRNRALDKIAKETFS
jgi:hypothetical protein